MTLAGRAVLIDFGLSIMREESSVTYNTSHRTGGNVRWMAPELMNLEDKQTREVPSDVWSFGCLVLQLMTGEKPYKKYNLDEPITLRLMLGEKPAANLNDEPMISQGLRELLHDCWENEPSRRLSMKVVEARLRDITFSIM